MVSFFWFFHLLVIFRFRISDDQTQTVMKFYSTFNRYFSAIQNPINDAQANIENPIFIIILLHEQNAL